MSVLEERPHLLVTFARYPDSPPWHQLDLCHWMELGVESLRWAEHPEALLCLEYRQHGNALWKDGHLLWISELSVKVGTHSSLASWTMESGAVSCGLVLPWVPSALEDLCIAHSLLRVSEMLISWAGVSGGVSRAFTKESFGISFEGRGLTSTSTARPPSPVVLT